MNNRRGYFLTPLIFIISICALSSVAYSQRSAEKSPGSIEGQITDASGRPVAQLSVTLTITAKNQEKSDSHAQGVITKPSDNQGNYKIENVQPGRYLVSIGYQNKYIPMLEPDGAKHPLYIQTFHPGTADIAKATVVEVEPGVTVTAVDITVEPPIKTCRISGRVIDDQTGEPISKMGFVITYQESDGGKTDIASSYWQSDDNGQFKMLVVLPGHITIKPSLSGKNSVVGDPVELDITDQDIAGLEIKMHLKQPQK